MADAAEAPVVPRQELTAPDRAVGPKPCSIQRDPNYLLGKTIFGHAARQVGMMVLDFHSLNAGTFTEPSRKLSGRSPSP